MKKEYQQCTRCVMDTSAKDIIFNKDGTCNYCTNFLHKSHKIFTTIQENNLDNLLVQIKQEGHSKKYDCIIGVSGGIDSSWALYNAVKLGLRPLAVHMDNGWNSELAQHNIANLVNILGVDLYTHVIHWDEYRSLMQSFFDADVIDVELLYDNAMLALNYQMARKYRVKYILSGSNHHTEGIYVPQNWNWFKLDKCNIKAINQKLHKVKMKTYLSIGTLDYVKYTFIHRIRWIAFLDYLNYNKEEALSILQKEVAYKPYPYKHYESIFTRFYQGFILPNKFGIDKRKIHFSTLIMSGQMNRKDALEDLKKIPYPSLQTLEEDKEYFLKKMRWKQKALDDYMTRPEVSHDQFSSEKKLYDSLLKVYKYFQESK